MRVDNVIFSDSNLSASRRPRYVIEIAFDNVATDLLYLTSHDDCDVPASAITAGEVIYKVVEGISGQTQQINPDQGNSTIGGFSFDVVDVGEALTVYIRDKLDFGEGLRHKQIVVYVGFEGMLWADYETVLTYIIDGADYQDGVYSFKCSDIQRRERQNIFAPTVRNLSKTVTATQAHIPVLTSDLTEFKTVEHDSSYTDHPGQTVAYARIEDEIFTHSGLFTHGTDGTSFQVVERGSLNSKAAEHVVDSSKSSDRQIKITEHVFIEGPAPKVIYALLTGILHNQGGATLPDNWHLGIDTGYVQLSDYTGIGDDLWNTTNSTGRHVRFDGVEETDGKKFIEKEILYWLGCFMPVYASGAFGLKRLSPILSNSGYVALLDKYNVRKYSSIKHDYSAVINQISIDWNFVYLKDEFTKTSALIDAVSIIKHNDAPIKKIKLLGVHTGAHTDNDIASYFDTLRDRYSGPPLKLSLEVMPSLNRLEVGDTVKVELDQVRDFNIANGTTLSRVFEIQRVQLDWLTGMVKLDLFGSSQKAGSLAKTALSAVLDDAFYSSAGTELSTVLTIVGGVVTADGPLTGGATLAAGVYYYLGDLTINAGVTVTIDANVELRIMGHLTINGTIDGIGGGGAGGVGASLWSNASTTIVTGAWEVPTYNATLGSAQFLGITKPGGDNGVDFRATDNKTGSYLHYTTPPTVISASSVSYFNVTNNAGASLLGMPTNLRGTGGTGGGAALTRNWVGSSNQQWVIQGAGGNGGAGGAGLAVISRGMSFGASGTINLSGADGVPAGTSYSYGGFVFNASTGAGGAPGACLVLLDGNYTPPDLGIGLVSLHGDSQIIGISNQPWGGASLSYLGKGSHYSDVVGHAGFDMGESAYGLQYIPEQLNAEIETNTLPPDVSGASIAIDNKQLLIKWSGIVSSELSHFEIRKGTVWASATYIAEVKFNYFNIEIPQAAGGAYEYLVKAVYLNGNESANAASVTITINTTAATALVLASGTANQITTSAGTKKSRIKISFTAPVDTDVERYLVEYKETSDTDYTRLPDLVGRTNVTCYIDNATYDVTYSVRIYAVNSLGVKSSALTGSHTVSGTSVVGLDQEVITTDGYSNSTFYWRTNWESLETLDQTYIPYITNNYGQSLKLQGQASSSVYATKSIINPFNDVTYYDSDIRFKTKVVITNASAISSTPAVLAYGTNIYSQIGFLFYWNTGTSMIDVYGYTYDQGAGGYQQLITSVADGALMEIECLLDSSASSITWICNGVSGSSGTRGAVPDPADTSGNVIFVASIPLDSAAPYITMEIGEYAVFKA